MNKPVTHYECSKYKAKILDEVEKKIRTEREIYSAQISSLTSSIADFKDALDEFREQIDKLTNYMMTIFVTFIVLILGALLDYFIRGGKI